MFQLMCYLTRFKSRRIWFFVFNTEQAKSLGTFSVKAKDETVESVLNKVLENTGMVFEFDGK